MQSKGFDRFDRFLSIGTDFDLMSHAWDFQSHDLCSCVRRQQRECSFPVYFSYAVYMLILQSLLIFLEPLF